MKALITADWHFSNNLPFAKKDPDTLVSDRLLDCVAVAEWIFDQARERNLPVFILGDLFDQKRPDSVTLKTVIRLLRSACESGIEVYILPGNHEAPNERGLHYVVDALAEANIPRLTVLEAGKVIRYDNINICPIPYRSRQETREYIQAYQENGKSNILLLHDTIIGASDKGWASDVGIPGEDLLDFVITLSGHFHEYQHLHFDVDDGIATKLKTVAVYPGSPLQLNFGDARMSPSIVILTTKGSKSVELNRLLVPQDLSSHFYIRELRDDQIFLKSFTEESAKYFKYIFQGTHKELLKWQPKINAKIEGWKSQARKIQFIHREIEKSKSRIKIDTISGLPSAEKLLNEYIDLFEREDKSTLIKLGIEALNGN